MDGDVECSGGKTLNKSLLILSASCMVVVATTPVLAQSGPVVVAQPVAGIADALPNNTLVLVTPAAEITSKKMKEGTKREFLVVEDVVQDGLIVIPRGSHVEATVTWRTGKGIVGKSAKFELSFDWVRVGSHNWKLRGTHRQEGRGNTAGALLGSMIITGRSAEMVPGQIVNVFTAEPIPFRGKKAQAAPTVEAPMVEEPANQPAQARPPAELKISSQNN